MDEKKKFEINDEMLESVSGGDGGRHRVQWIKYEGNKFFEGETVKMKPCRACGATEGVIAYLFSDGYVKVDRNCGHMKGMYSTLDEIIKY